MTDVGVHGGVGDQDWTSRVVLQVQDDTLPVKPERQQQQQQQQQ